MCWIWRTGFWLSSQREVSSTCVSVQLLVAELFCCVSRPGTLTWLFPLRQMLFIIAVEVLGVGRVGASGNLLSAEALSVGHYALWLLLTCAAFSEKVALRWALSVELCIPLVSPTCCRSYKLPAALYQCDPSHRLLQLLCCNMRGSRPGLPLRHRAYRPVPTSKKDVYGDRIAPAL